MDAFRYAGEWWLPERPDDVVEGELIFSPDEGLSLELVSMLVLPTLLEGKGTRSFSSFAGRPLVSGRIGDGVPVTLREVSGNGQAFGQGYATEKFEVEQAFIGVHMVNEDDVRWREVVVEYPYLMDWLVADGKWPVLERMGESSLFRLHSHYGLSLVHTQELESDGEYLRTYVGGTLKYQAPIDPVYSYSTEQGSLSVSDNFVVSDTSSNPQEVVISQTAVLHFRPNASMTFSEVWEQFLEPIGDLLSFSTGKPNGPIGLLLYQAVGDNLQAAHIKDVPTPLDEEATGSGVRVTLNTKFYRSRPTETMHPRAMTLHSTTAPDGNIGKLLDKWLKVRAELYPIYRLLIDNIMVENLYVSQAFPSAVQAVHSYFAARHPQAKARTLRAKLIALTDMRDPVSGALFTNKVNRDEFIHQVLVAARNINKLLAVSQTDSEDESRPSLFSRHLYLLLQTLILRELGLDVKQRKEVISRRRSAGLYQSSIGESGGVTIDEVDESASTSEAVLL